jgi:hypothetical protein
MHQVVPFAGDRDVVVQVGPAEQRGAEPDRGRGDAAGADQDDVARLDGGDGHAVSR